MPYNELKKADPVDVSNLTGAYSASLLYNDIGFDGILCTGTQAKITAEWKSGTFFDSIALLSSNFVNAEAALVFNDNTTWSKSYAREPIFYLGNKKSVKKLTLTVYANTPVIIGEMFCSPVWELPLFKIQPSYEYKSTGAVEWADTGAVYGTSKIRQKTMSVIFERITNEQRLLLEEYIDIADVFNPHIIAPYDAPEFAPFFGVLEDHGGFAKRNENGFFWDTQLSWREVK
jgi:hypothetical protein